MYISYHILIEKFTFHTLHSHLFLTPPLFFLTPPLLSQSSIVLSYLDFLFNRNDKQTRSHVSHVQFSLIFLAV